MAKKSDFNTSRSVKDLQAEYGKMPPQAVDLEEAVLGALMLERDAFSIVGALLEPDAFYKDAHQKIFRAIESTKAVLPIAGRAAMITKSEGCQPEVTASKALKPEGSPLIPSGFSAAA